MLEEEFLSLTEAAEYLGVSRVKMSQLVREAVVPYVTSPLDRRLKLVRREALDPLLAPRRRRGRAEKSDQAAPHPPHLLALRPRRLDGTRGL